MISHPFYFGNMSLIFFVICFERRFEYNLAQNEVMIAVKSDSKSSVGTY